MQKWHLKPETVDRICRDDPSRPRILMMNYPSNPTGARLAVDELAELAEVAKKYRLLVLSDEIYGGVDFRYFTKASASLVSCTLF